MALNEAGAENITGMFNFSRVFIVMAVLWLGQLSSSSICVSLQSEKWWSRWSAKDTKKADTEDAALTGNRQHDWQAAHISLEVAACMTLYTCPTVASPCRPWEYTLIEVYYHSFLWDLMYELLSENTSKLYILLCVDVEILVLGALPLQTKIIFQYFPELILFYLCSYGFQDFCLQECNSDQVFFLNQPHLWSSFLFFQVWHGVQNFSFWGQKWLSGDTPIAW